MIISRLLSSTVFVFLAQPAFSDPTPATKTSPVPATAPAASTPKTPVPAIPAGFERVTVCRTKKLLETWTAAGLKSDLLHDLGYGDLLTPRLEKADPGNIVSYAVGFTTKGFTCTLCTLATPCTLADFITMTGNKPDDYPGDDTLRQKDSGFGKSRYLTIYRQFSPQEYMMSEDTGGAAPAEPAKALAAVRSAVAGSGQLFWTSGRTLHLSAGFFGPENDQSFALKNLEVGIRWQDDLVLDGRATFNSPGLAKNFIALAGKKVPPMPAFPGTAGEALSPRQELGTTGNVASYQLIFPKAVAAVAVPALLEGVQRGQDRSIALRDARKLAFVYTAAIAAGCKSLTAATSVPNVLDLLNRGVPLDSTTPNSPRFQEYLKDTPAFRRLLASYLVLENGKLSLSPVAEKEIAEDNQKDADVAATHPAAIARARLNAQNLCAAFIGASAAGSPDIAKVQSATEAVDALVRGTVGLKPFANKTFHVILSETDRQRALEYIAWDDGKLHYLPH